MARRRTIAILAAVLALLLGVVPAAGADEGPLDGEARRILATAAPGLPLKVVTTSRSDAGPRITTATASSAGGALALIEAALARPSTIGVDMAQRVTIAAGQDTYRSKQYALTRFQAEKVWLTSSGRGVVVAVVDTGVRRDHPDLAGQVLAGRDFVAPGTPATDQNGHGTHVAGIIAARAGNGRGVAGLAKSSRILPVRVLDAAGSGDTAAVARGIVWAVKHGADVVNLSLGTTRSDTATREAVAYAVSRNVVVVAAAGNDGCAFLFGSPTTYPASYPDVIGVAAVDRNGATASYSSCGSWVDVAAPGSDIFSTMIARPDSRLGCPATAMYCSLSGTSMASPQVAASAALLIARLGKGWRASTVGSIIQGSADDVGAAGRDRSTGTGIINPRRMLRGR